MMKQPEPISVFLSYAHEDEPLRKELEKHLSLLQRQGLISTWQDRRITAGTSWAREIDEHLKNASIILLLISADFLASDYCYGVETQCALDRDKARQAKVIPIALRPCDWKDAPFAHLQALPTDARPLTKWPDRDDAWADVIAGIRRVIEELPPLSVSTSPAALPPIWNVPSPHNPLFTGREELLTQLATSLHAGQPTALSQPQAISSLGGIGKTQLAPHHPLHASIVRIRDESGTIHGAGFLAAPELICTCAHVVADALHIPRETEQSPKGEVHLDFPFLGEAEGNACMKVWVPMEPNEGGGDIAVLRLTTNPPSAARPVRLLPVSHLSGRAFEAYGFPRTTDVGQYAYGILRDRLANGYVQLEGTTRQGYRVQQGYSGTPVWDSNGRGVVGVVVAEEQDPEAKVAFLIPIDLILRACPDIKPITLHHLFAPLTDGLTELPSSPLSGVEQFLREYLGMPEVPAPFGGRQVQLAELDHWLANPGQPYALLIAEAGRGKSALLTRWVTAVADEQRAEVAFVPISIRFSTSLKSTTLGLLGARLRHLHSVRADLPRDTEGWLAEIEMYLREDRPIGSPLLIVLDGADEAADWMVGRDLRFPPQPGRGIKVLVSARSLADCDAVGWVRRLEWQGLAVPMELPLLDQVGVAEVLRSMGDPLTGLGTRVDVVSELHRLSGGDPLLVRLYVEALQTTAEHAAFLTPEDLRRLEPGLQAYFDQWWNDLEWQWEKQGRDQGSEREDIMDFFRLCALALGPLSRDEVAAIADGRLKSGSRLRTVASKAGRFIIGDGRTQGYIFSHPRLGYYFREEQMIEPERLEWEQRFLGFGRSILEQLNSGKLDPRQTPPYAVRYYGVHLERGDADPEYFNDLICQGWQRAWEAIEGTYDGFLSDLTRAWKRAEAVGTWAQSTQERSRAIGWQCRYALIVASIKSLAGNIPPTLLVALVDKGVWTPVQGLASARQIPHEEQRAEALAGLASHLSAPLLQEALEAVRAITDEGWRAQALAGLASHLSAPLLQEALEAARAITDEWWRARALAGLAPRLGELGYGKEALEAVRAIIDEGSRAQALAGLASHLSAPLLQEALEAARAITDEWWRARALAGLAPRLGELGYGKEALEAVRAIIDEGSRAQALAGLAPYLSAPLLQEALEAARAITSEGSRAQALAGLAPYLSAPLLQEALEAARTITAEGSRAQALTGLASHLSAPLQGIALQEALEAARAITAEGSRAQALAGLASHLSAPLLQEALEAARAITDEGSRARVLTGLAPHLSAPLLQEALEAARAITDEWWRAQALAGLAPRLGELGYGKEALEAVRAITDEWWRAQALAGLASHLSAPLLQEALEAARAITAKGSRAQALAGLALHLSAPLLQEALEAARAITDEWWRAQALAGLAPRLGELGYGKEALEAARAITDEWRRAQALAGLAPYLSAPLLQEALEAARAITSEGSRAQALAGLAPYLSAPLLQEALEAARAITSEGSRAQALAGLAPRLGELGYGKEALEAVRAITDEGWRAQALAGLASHLSAPLQGIALQEALEAARTITAEGSRAQALAGLAPRVKQLPVVRLYALWSQTLHILAIHTRSDLLSDIQALVPFIAALGEKEALVATMQAIIEVGKWFP